MSGNEIAPSVTLVGSIPNDLRGRLVHEHVRGPDPLVWAPGQPEPGRERGRELQRDGQQPVEQRDANPNSASITDNTGLTKTTTVTTR
ncbi:MAG: hypothetical protein IPO29_10910 [Anaerolineae bacterium]|nr:hypothetical protein [Anaerolineae bacterium]